MLLKLKILFICSGFNEKAQRPEALATSEWNSFKIIRRFRRCGFGRVSVALLEDVYH